MGQPGGATERKKWHFSRLPRESGVEGCSGSLQGGAIHGRKFLVLKSGFDDRSEPCTCAARLREFAQGGVPLAHNGGAFVTKPFRAAFPYVAILTGFVPFRNRSVKGLL